MSLTRIGSVMNSKNFIGGERRGFALLTVIMLTLAMAALAASAVYLAGNAGLLATSTDREREFKYGAEAAMAIGKSRLNTDPLVLPDTGFVTLMSGQQVIGADGQSLPGVTVNLYTGPTGSTSGQFGRFASVVAEARDASGARFVRRLELTQESFARFAYWSNKETNASGGTIYFANHDNLWGPVWSNDVISIASSGAKFHGDVGTAKTISGKNYGTFDKGLHGRTAGDYAAQQHDPEQACGLRRPADSPASRRRLRAMRQPSGCAWSSLQSTSARVQPTRRVSTKASSRSTRRTRARKAGSAATGTVTKPPPRPAARLTGSMPTGGADNEVLPGFRAWPRHGRCHVVQDAAHCRRHDDQQATDTSNADAQPDHVAGDRPLLPGWRPAPRSGRAQQRLRSPFFRSRSVAIPRRSRLRVCTASGSRTRARSMHVCRRVVPPMPRICSRYTAGSTPVRRV